MHNIISCTLCICYFLLDVRANQSGGTWVPWSIDSLWKIVASNVLYTRNIISCTSLYLQFSLCSGEPVRLRVSSLNYKFICTVPSSTLPAYYHLIYACICYFLLDVRANQSGGTWVPWSIDSFEKYTSCTLYHICIISSHVRYVSVIFFWMFGRTSPAVREFPEV